MIDPRRNTQAQAMMPKVNVNLILFDLVLT